MKTRSDRTFRKADPDHRVSSGTTCVRVAGARFLIQDPSYQVRVPLAMNLGPSGSKFEPDRWSNREVISGLLQRFTIALSYSDPSSQDRKDCTSFAGAADLRDCIDRSWSTRNSQSPKEIGEQGGLTSRFRLFQTHATLQCL